MTGDDVAVAIDDELLEVPEDGGLGLGLDAVAGELGAEGAGLVGGGLRLGGDELLVEGMGVGAGDGDLLEEREGDVEAGLAEGGDLVVGSGLLAGEVVGREGEDLEAVGLAALVELFEGFVLGGEAALGGGVDDQQGLAAIVGERGGLAGDLVDGNVVEICHSAIMAQLEGVEEEMERWQELAFEWFHGCAIIARAMRVASEKAEATNYH